jgi:hypothetical protein
MCARLGVGVQFSAPHAHNMLGKAERPFVTMRRPCFIACLSPIRCGRTRSVMLCISATAHSVARLVPPVAPRSPSSRPRRPTLISSVYSGALSLRRCLTNSAAKWAKWHSEGSWSAIQLELKGNESTILSHAASPHQSMLSFRRTPPASVHPRPSTH